MVDGAFPADLELLIRLSVDPDTGALGHADKHVYWDAVMSQHPYSRGRSMPAGKGGSDANPRHLRLGVERV
jgi:hypothetical protein